MASTPEPVSLAERLTLEQFPRSAAYDPAWTIEHRMGPNVLWLTEFLTEAVRLQPGMRVLDMGCGRALSSIFLAREFGVQVWATDLWIRASDNWQRVCEAGLQDRICPVHAEAHSLPFAAGFFDAAVSLDAYHYFGTDDLYLGYYARFVRPEGQIGIVVPGLKTELGGAVPPHLAPYWHWDFCSFHSPDWWRTHWAKSGLVDVTVADWLPEGWKLWQMWNEVCDEQAGRETPGEEAEMLRVDAGRTLGFTRVVARRRASPSYDSPLYRS
ncbi:MAG TPA: methyltransferase domain-containing protein [Chloroflexota bacterium]|nr:methyltransferase domain-containing protein [Chloroflexota bacterium]